jgi:Kef-type K+ transport system membrane component KefB
MFTAGLETDMKQLRSSLKSSLIIAVIGVLLPLVGGFSLSHYGFGIGVYESVFIGLILTATSISITVETLNEMGNLKTKTGTTTLGASIIDDIIGIVLLSIIIGISKSGDSTSSISLTDLGFILLKIGVFFVFAWLFGKYMYVIMERIADERPKLRRLTILGIAYCFFSAYVAEKLGLADITGAYLAGLSLSGSKAEYIIEKRSTELSYLFFSPIFFVSVGLYATFEGLNARTLLFAFILLIVAVLSKFLGCGAGAKLCKFTNMESAQVGAGMISRGEVAIIVASKGVVMGLLNSHLFSSIIVVILLTTLITPLLLMLLYKGKRKQN